MSHPQPSSPMVDEVALKAARSAMTEWLRYRSIYDAGVMQFHGDEVANAAVTAYLAALVSPPKAGEGEPVAYADRYVVARLVPNAEVGTMYGKPQDQFSIPLYATQPRVDGVRVKPLSLDGFAVDFAAAMDRTGATARGLAEEIGVDKSAISRARRGKQVSQENFIALLNWLRALANPGDGE